MTRPDLAWAYSELSKYVQFPERITCLLPNIFCAIFAALGIKQFATLVILTKTPNLVGLGRCGLGWRH